MKNLLTVLILYTTGTAYCQKAEDVLNVNAPEVSWLGVDFSHAKLIGDFSQFNGIGEKSPAQIRNYYFSAWNKVILNERNKYDLENMLRIDDITYDVDMIFDQNYHADLSTLESYNNPKYSQEDIIKFVNAYDLQNKKGIGVALIAESLNKAETEAYFHFVVINLSDKKVLVHERLRGEPRGFGIRNYWAGAIYDVLKQIEDHYAKTWRQAYVNR